MVNFASSNRELASGNIFKEGISSAETFIYTVSWIIFEDEPDSSNKLATSSILWESTSREPLLFDLCRSNIFVADDARDSERVVVVVGRLENPLLTLLLTTISKDVRLLTIRG